MQTTPCLIPCFGSSDTKLVSLHDLRSRITAITQEPLLTSGTLRETLDISGELGETLASHPRMESLTLQTLADDHELYSALKRVHLIHGNEDTGEKGGFHDLDSFVAVESVMHSELPSCTDAHLLPSGVRISVWENVSCWCWREHC